MHGPQTVPQPPPLSPRQAQVNLDHDYCSSSNKANRRNRERGGNGAPYVVGKASPRSSGSPTSGGSSPGGNKTVIRVSSTPVNMKRLRESTSHVVAVARSNAPLAAAMLAASTKPDPPPRTMMTHYSFGSGFHVQQQQQQKTVTSVGVPMSAVVKTEPVASAAGAVKEEPIFDESSNSPSPPPPSSHAPRSTLRRDSDPGRKDSGLESGDVSDSSLNNEDEMYSRLPPYLTVLPAVVKVEGAAGDDKGSALGGYDRLPGYVKGLSRSATPVMDLKEESLEQVRSY